MNIAIYTDDVDIDPIVAIEAIKARGIDNIVLRTVWSNNIASVDDKVIKAIYDAIQKNKMKVVMIATRIGETKELNDHTALKRAIDLTQYFDSKLVRIHWGKQAQRSVLEKWLHDVALLVIPSGITPVVETMNHLGVGTAAELAALLSEYPIWKVLYDPGRVTLKPINTYIEYWSLLRKHIVALDVSDSNATRGACLLGSGKGHWSEIAKDIFNGWYFFEYNAHSHDRKKSFFEYYDHAINFLHQMRSRSNDQLKRNNHPN